MIIAYLQPTLKIQNDRTTGVDEATGQNYKIEGSVIFRDKTGERIIYGLDDPYTKSLIFPGIIYPYMLTETGVLLKENDK